MSDVDETEDSFDFAEVHADLFCINAEVREILDRHREPRDMDDPAYWNGVKRQALTDWEAGHVPIWRGTEDGKWIFFGYESDPEACRRRDEYDETARNRGRK